MNGKLKCLKCGNAWGPGTEEYNAMMNGGECPVCAAAAEKKTEDQAQRGPANKQEWLEGVLKLFSDYQRFQDAELAADDIRQAFQDGLRLEPAPPTTDDLIERRIAQAERVVALYQTWLDMLWPRDLVTAEPADQADDGPTFQEWLAEQMDAIVEGLALPTNRNGWKGY